MAIWTCSPSHKVWFLNIDSANSEDVFKIINELCSGRLDVECDVGAQNLMNLEFTICEKPNTRYRYAFISDEVFPDGISYETARTQAFRGDFTDGIKTQPVSCSGAVRLLKQISCTIPLNGDMVLMLNHQSISQHDDSINTLMYRNFGGRKAILTHKLCLQGRLPKARWYWYVVELIEE